MGTLLNFSNNSKFDFPDHVRKTHMHIIGGSGKGKSTLMLQWILEDIDNGKGVCLIDPHGSLIDQILCEINLLDRQFFKNHYSGKKYPITLIEPSKSKWVTPINPLHGHLDDAVGIERIKNAILASWGQFDQSLTPRLSTILSLVLEILIVNKLFLSDALRVLTDEVLRDKLLQNCSVDLRLQWEQLGELKDNEFIAFTESARNRLFPFNRAATSKRLFGYMGQSWNVFSKMQQGEIILVNLAPSDYLHESTSKLIGTLIVNDIIATAKRYNPHLVKSSYLYIDECYQYLNEDIARALEETRKFGLHFILAHQNLGQLKEKGDRVKDSIMAIQNKLVFGGCSVDDTKLLAEDVFRDLDLIEFKPNTGDPIVVGYKEKTVTSHSFSTGENYSNSHGTTTSLGKTKTISSGGGTGFSMPLEKTEFSISAPDIGQNSNNSLAIPNRIFGEANSPINFNKNINHSESEGENYNLSDNESYTEGYSNSHTISYSTRLDPVLGVSKGSLYSLEEQKHRKSASLSKLKMGECVLKFDDKVNFLKVTSPPQRKSSYVFNNALSARISIYLSLAGKGIAFPAKIIDEKIANKFKDVYSHKNIGKIFIDADDEEDFKN